MEMIFIAAIPAVISGVVSYILASNQIKKSRADLMVIQSAKHYLSHKTNVERSFESLKKALGGWDNDEDELRRILVSAGAIRTYRSDNSEWWSLLTRGSEKSKNQKI
ncbi:hypothetical protein [Luteibaculum oceani]|uniref:Type II secretion system protein n=1 Tax=Luteibaculum oceani TaxID=1294296 RepID=A0A5C6UZF3_9FLAO|nr:hypothetical protein [Luteibaculum oceani]TXC78772.1 hypothetical protein FRX97_06025 [Luteibaculum oceani]